MLNALELSQSIAKHILEWPADANIIAIDTETSGTRWINDRIVCYVFKDLRTGKVYRWHRNEKVPTHLFGEKVCLVGHNLKFDLEFLFGNLFLKPNQVYGVWDTMVAEYILSGQEARMASLESLYRKYSIPVEKSTLITDTLAEGKTVEDINPEVLLDYCKTDVLGTALVFHEQLKQARNQGQVGLIKLEGQVTLAYVEMEMNGLCLDVHALEDLLAEYKETEKDALDKCHTLLADAFGMTVEEYKCTGLGVTPRMISYAIFGLPEEVKYTVRQPNGVTKSGKPKFKNEQVPIVRKWPMSLYPSSVNVSSTLGVSLSEDSVDAMLAFGLGGDARDLLHEYTRYRDAIKILHTYILPFMSQFGEYGSIYPTINQAVTRTTRASSSNPNGQNMPPIIRQLIKADEDHYVVASFDYSQVEVCAAAQHTKSPSLIDDLCSGISVHENVQLEAFGRILSDEEAALKRAVKGIVFGTIYGGGVKALAKQTKTDPSMVDKIRTSLLKLYPEISTVPRRIIELYVEKNRLPSYEVSDSGVMLGKGFYQCPQTNIRYVFTQQTYKVGGPKPYFTGASWPVPKVADYPVQGLAAYLMKLYLVSLYVCTVFPELALDLQNINLTMVVHDELVAEIPIEDCTVIADKIKFIGEKVVPMLFKELSDTDFVVPLRVESTVNTHWS